MQPLVAAAFIERTSEGARFAFDSGWECRICILADDLFRVLFVPPDGLREPRTWMVAPGGIDVPWEGRNRLRRLGIRASAVRSRGRRASDCAADCGIARRSAATPVRHRLVDTGQSAFCRRPSDPGVRMEPSHDAIRHYMARLSGDRYFGLGDKTGPLDKHGRRLRTVALDALGHDAQTSDPLYKHWPFLIARDAASEVAYGLFYDTLSNATFDLGCEYDNYHGFYRYCEIDDGDLDYYVFVGERIRDVTRKFAGLTGRMALRSPLEPGYANTAMSLADAPDAQASLPISATRQPRTKYRSARSISAPATASIGKPSLRVHVESRQVPRSARARSTRFRRRDARRRQYQAMPARRPSGVWRRRRHVAHSSAMRRPVQPCVGQFWDGRARRSISRIPKVSDGGRTLRGESARLRHRRRLERQQRIRNLGRRRRIARVRRGDPDRPFASTASTADDARDGRSAGRASSRRARVHRHARGAAWNPALRADVVWRQHDELAHAALEPPHGSDDEPLRHIQHRATTSAASPGPSRMPELLVRWVQSGMFSPRFIMNSWKVGRRDEHAVAASREYCRSFATGYGCATGCCRISTRSTGGRRNSASRCCGPTFYDFEQDMQTFDDCDDFMCGPNLLVASVVEPGRRERSVYLPVGPAEWFDFWDGRRVAAGQTIVAPAPLERIPLFVPAGGMIPTTATADMARLHDEPSRALRIYPGAGRATRVSRCTKMTATACHCDGESADIVFEMTTTTNRVVLKARKSGRYVVPYETIRVLAPATESRPLQLDGQDIGLVRA